MTIAALIIVPVCAALCSVIVPRSRQYIIEYIALAVAIIETILGFSIARAVLAQGTLHASSLFSVDALGAFVLLFTTIVGLAATIHSIGHLREEERKGIIGFRRDREYFVLFHLFFAAMFVAAATASPIIMWTAIEATTLATAFLISFYNKPSAIEAGWKHLIINSVGLLLGFLGTLLFINAAGDAGAGTAFITWDTLRAIGATLNPTLIKIAFVFALVGYGTKVGFVPMHTWLPDAHSKAPIPISSLLSGVLLNMALIAVLRFRAITDLSVDPSFTQHLLIGFGIVSLVVAAFIIFGQKNYKRMLAYSSIEHMGILGIGFGIGGAATVAALFHMLYHALLKPILFFCAGNFFLTFSSTKIAKIRGAMTLLPVSSAVFFAALLAASGIPPSGIFMTEISILAAGMQKYPYLMLLMLAALAIVLAGFLRNATAMLFSEASSDIPAGEPSGWTLVSIGLLSSIFLVLSIYIPAGLAALITNATAIIQ